MHARTHAHMHNVILMYTFTIHTYPKGQESHVQNVASPAAPRALPFTPHPSHEWSYILGAEEQELETMVSELTAAFPPPDSHFGQ